jgi:hypothetical protein
MCTLQKLLTFALCLGLSITTAGPAWAQDEEDDDFEEDSSLYTLAELAGLAAYDKCECPDSEDELDQFTGCMEKQAKRASKAFVKSLKYLEISRGEFKTALGDQIDFLVSECEDSFDSGDEDDDFEDGDEFPEDDFPDDF